MISDTHLPRGSRALPAACVERLREADLILHAGDLTTAEVLADLRALGPPVEAVHGNADDVEVRRLLPSARLVAAGGARIAMVHDAGPAGGRLGRLRARFRDADAVVFGHSHIPLHERDGAGGFQIFNPGSPTDRRRQPNAHDGPRPDRRRWRRGLRARRSRVNVAERVQTSIRSVNAAEREAIGAGPFTLYRNPASDHPYLNYAVPDPRARTWEGIEELRGAFAAHGLQPRLEFVAECAPGLEEALAAAGFELQDRLPVMTLAAGGLRAAPTPADVALARVAAGDPEVRALLEVAADAFGSDWPSDAQVEAYGGRGVLARAEGEPAGAAFFSPVAEGVSELAGIGVRERFRRRGIAAALTAAAATAAFGAGAQLCFLTPGDGGAERVYERAGFARAGTTMVHMTG